MLGTGFCSIKFAFVRRCLGGKANDRPHGLTSDAHTLYAMLRWNGDKLDELMHFLKKHTRSVC